MTLLDELKKEAAELQVAIAVLERREGKTPAKSVANKNQPKAHGRKWSEADRKRMSLAVKRAIAARKAKKTRKPTRKPRAKKVVAQAAS